MEQRCAGLLAPPPPPLDLGPAAAQRPTQGEAGLADQGWYGGVEPGAGVGAVWSSLEGRT